MLLEWLDAKLPIVAVLLLFPITFMFHDFEEILTVEKWTKENKEKVFTILPEKFHKFFYSSFQINTLHFAIDVFWIFLSITTATMIAVFFEFYLFYLIFLAIFFTHVFTHLGQAIILKQYTPGVVTSILIVLPYSSYAYSRLLKEHVIQIDDLIWSFLGMLIAVPILFLYLVGVRNRVAKK